MRKFLLATIFIFLNIKNSTGIEMRCDFEEVYLDGSVQQGILLLKEDKIRYQYKDLNLYTLLYSDHLYLVQNQDRNGFQKLEEKSFLFKEIINIFSDFPNFNETYRKDDLYIKVDKSSDHFIKRIGIISNDVTLSINILNCKNERIFDRYFRHFPLEPYN